MRRALLLLLLGACAPEPTPAQAPLPVRPTLQQPLVTSPAPTANTAAAPAPSVGPAAPVTTASTPSPPPEDDEEPPVVASGPMSDTQRAVMTAAGVCIKKGLDGGDTSTGSLAIELSVDDAGKVSNVDLGPGYGPRAKSCLEPRLKQVRYPAQPNGGIRVVRYPIDELEDDAAP